MYKTKTIKREIYHIIIPMILENILQISANLVTTAMVGRLLANDIAAQGICVRITDTLWVFYKGGAIGATVLIAKAYGTGKKEDCRKIMEQTLLTELILVFVFQVVLFFRADIFIWFLYHLWILTIVLYHSSALAPAHLITAILLFHPWQSHLPDTAGRK